MIDNLESMLNSLVKNSYERAVKRNRECNITYSDLLTLWHKQNGLCALSNYPMSAKVNDQYKVSIDRIDSQYGYTVNNIQLVCRIANRIKSNLPNQTFIDLCCAIANKHQL